MRMYNRLFHALPGLFLLLCCQGASAADYPNMVGKWSGNVRIVEAGTSRESEIAPGGMLITDVELVLTIDHQDGESFMGKSRNSRTASDVPSTRVWGSIRSNGKEGIFITNSGASGQIWFDSANSFEYCITSRQETLVQAYCARLSKSQ